MKKVETVMVEKKEINTGGYEVLEINMSDSTDNLYAVCTPVKMS